MDNFKSDKEPSCFCRLWDTITKGHLPNVRFLLIIKILYLCNIHILYCCTVVLLHN